MASIWEEIRVLDFGMGFAPSLATMILADNGAEIIKVEPPGGDSQRSEPAWLMWNRGKKSVVLDLEQMADRNVARELARGVDVVVESFLPGRAEQLGIGYEVLSETNPGLLYCSLSAFGSSGAYRR